MTYIDVRETKRREQETAESRALLATTLDNMDQGILVLDAAMNIRLWNERIVDLLKLPQGFIRPGLPMADILRFVGLRAGRTPEAQEQRTVEILANFRQEWGMTANNLNPDGRVIETRRRPMPDGGVVITYTDVTERSERERLLDEKSRLLSATLANMEQGILVLDDDLNILTWNERLVRMFALPPEYLHVGLNAHELIRYLALRAGRNAEDADKIASARAKAYRRGELVMLSGTDTSGRVLERRSRPLTSGGFAVIYTDVTERRGAEEESTRAREEAELASRVKTEFMANMSHELRTPLNAIIGFSDIMVKQLYGPLGQERYAEYARDIRESGEHLLSVINDVLDVAKVEINKIELREETVNCTAVVDAGMRLVRERAIAAGVTVTKRIQPNLPAITADERRLKQIVLNILSNAVKFTPQGGTVKVTVASDEEGFKIEVADTGIGIAEQDIERVLAPFGQIDSRLARRYDGTGLGLPLARSLTELHGGRLEITSKLAHGTTVTIWLPPARILESRVRTDSR